MIIEHEIQGRNQCFKIGERLAHPHDHNIRDDPVTGRVKTQRLVGKPKLANDFRGSEVAVKTLFTG